MNWGKIWQVVRKPDNIFFIATVLNQFRCSSLEYNCWRKSHLLLTVIVALLGLLAFAQLTSNYQALEQQERFSRIEKQEEEIAREIKNLTIPPGVVLKDRTALPPLESEMEQAKEVLPWKKVIRLGGLWKDIPFDVTDEDISALRQAVTQHLLNN